ncbi:MAG: Fe(3+) ABC transporter substrate-binding protein [Alphaproteobacteria bacterium]|nr:Fe(3+) ABC transporter substrate-binding protein [Alphaproteobacteria bacterium]
MRKLVLALPLALGLAQTPATAEEVNLYSYRQEALIKPLLDAFTRKSKIKVNLISGGEDALIERLKAEGAASPADLLMTVDAGRLIRAKELGLFQPVKSPGIEEVVPPQLRDPEGNWTALSVRARPIMYAADRVNPSVLSTYEDLASAKWKGKVCVRSSSHVYNQSMLSAMIEAVGSTKAEAWAKGLADNLARTPQGGDRDQLKALAAGECDVALVNTYYLAGMLASKDPADRAVASKVKVFWPNQSDRGVHVNVSGIAVTKSARNILQAVALIEFLLSDEAQKIYAEVVGEFPVKAGIARSSPVASFGTFKAETVTLASLARHNAEAVRIFDRVGWR